MILKNYLKIYHLKYNNNHNIGYVKLKLVKHIMIKISRTVDVVKNTEAN